MGIFDTISKANPLPSFDVSLPDVNVQSFLPDFTRVGDAFGSLNMPDFSIGGSFYGGTSMGNMFSGLGGLSSSWKSMLPSFSGNGNTWTFPWSSPSTVSSINWPGGGVGAASGDFSALNQYDQWFAKAGATVGISGNWIKAIAMMENGINDPVSGAGALGIMQIMPNGYPELEKLYPNWRTDPGDNIMLGAAILKAKIDENGGSLDAGIMAYLGSGTDKYTGVTTDQYLKSVKDYYNQLSTTTQGGGYYGGSSVGFDSIFGGVGYSISSENGMSNGQPASWYGSIDDELGNPVGAHPGVDVAIPLGTTLYMPKGLTGVVEVASGEGGYGYDPTGGVARSGPGTGELLIRLSNGDVILLGHMQSIYLTPGQTVSSGQALGKSGTAGSGPHVHFEYRTPGNTSSGWVVHDPRQFIR